MDALFIAVFTICQSHMLILRYRYIYNVLCSPDIYFTFYHSSVTVCLWVDTTSMMYPLKGLNGCIIVLIYFYFLPPFWNIRLVETRLESSAACEAFCLLCYTRVLLTSTSCLWLGRTPLPCRIIRFKCLRGNCIISRFPCFNAASFFSLQALNRLPWFSLPSPPMSVVQDYLHSLGKARTAQVQKDARIGEAQYKRDAVIRVNDGMRSSIPLKIVTCNCLRLNDNFCPL